MKKLLVIIMAISMLLGVAACEDVTETTDTDATEEDKSARTIVEVDGFKIPEIELQNPTLKFFGLNQPQFDEGDEGIVRIFFEEFYGGEIEYEMVSLGDMYTTLAANVLAGDSPDLVTAHEGFPALALTEVIQPVDGLLDFNLDIIKEREDVYKQYRYDGNHYFIPWVTPVNQLLFYNTRMFENYDLESPRSLYEKGQWDWNKFLEYAQELTVDETGDGNPDVWGVAMCGWHDARLIFTTGEVLARMDEGGRLQSNLGSSNIQRAANFFADMFLDHNVADPNRDPNHVMSQFDSAQAAMMIGPGFWHGTDSAFPNIKEARSVEVAPLPKDPQAQEHHVEAYPIGFYLPVGARNKQAAEAFTYAAIVAQSRVNVPGSPEYNRNKENFLANWEEFGYTESDFEDRQTFLAALDRELSLVVNPYNALLDVDALFGRLIGAAGATPQTYQQAIAELEPDFKGLIEDIYQEAQEELEESEDTTQSE